MATPRKAYVYVPPCPFEIDMETSTRIKVTMFEHSWLLLRSNESTSYVEVHAVVLSTSCRRIGVIGRRDGQGENKFIPIIGQEIIGTAPLLRQACRQLLWVSGFDYKPLTS